MIYYAQVASVNVYFRCKSPRAVGVLLWKVLLLLLISCVHRHDDPDSHLILGRYRPGKHTGSHQAKTHTVHKHADAKDTCTNIPTNLSPYSTHSTPFLPPHPYTHPSPSHTNLRPQIQAVQTNRKHILWLTSCDSITNIYQ